MKKYLMCMALSAICLSASAQQFKMAGANDERTKKMDPRHSEFYDPQPAKVTPGDITTNSAPSDAIVLFDGKDLSMWVNDKGEASKWIVNGDGTMTVNKQDGNLVTKDYFRDFQLHLEWCVPADIEGEGQARGNSGVFLQGMYEVQILDSYNNETYVNGMAASLYKQSAPLVCPIRKPGEWNVYDIIYTAPTFKEDGTYRTHPFVTVLFNGVLVQNNTMLVGTTEYVGFPAVQKHGDGPISLQMHGDPSKAISFRNIWLRKL
ncbi:MAG: DUF1080 domain-containing protein [Bacteroidales bacterium]|nr:DUF1080 domain-containing protein [Candidatus Cryptobacteroides onthequi]MCQ2164223.1 DUF1080 domain-containing protein [Bacteroidales bacterium]